MKPTLSPTVPIRYWHIAVNHKYIGSAPQDEGQGLTSAEQIITLAIKKKRLKEKDFIQPAYIHFVASNSKTMSKEERIKHRLVRSNAKHEFDHMSAVKPRKAYLAPKLGR